MYMLGGMFIASIPKGPKLWGFFFSQKAHTKYFEQWHSMLQALLIYLKFY